MLGLERDVNRLVEHDPTWAGEFAREAAALRRVLPASVVAIEHYGSTAVPGLAAKPILDLLIGVEAIEQWVGCLSPLVSLGYEHVPGAGVPGHQVFGKGAVRTHLAHLVQHGGDSWRRGLALRDALRADAALRDAYERAKRAAVARAPIGRAMYNDLKGPCIESILERLRW
jgi:GrpB-like predicted nucleotidyltransferase (UPF0157 family)